MKKLTSTNANTLGEWAYLGIEKHLHKILKHEDDVIQDKGSESVHQMRVGTRRLRSVLTGFAPALNLPKDAQEEKIAKIAHRLGALRDFDVQKEALENYQSILPKSEKKHLAKAFKQIDKQRQYALEQVQSSLKSKSYQHLKQAYQDWLQHPTYRELAQIQINDILPELLLPPVSKLFLEIGWYVGILAKTKDNNLTTPINPDSLEQLLAEQGINLHHLRKQTKRVRYQMELFTDFYDSEYEEYLHDLKAVQEVLGKIQDSVILTEFLEDIFKSEIKSEMPTLANQLKSARYEAWQEWQPLQQKYVNFQVKQAMQLVLLKPSSKMEVIYNSTQQESESRIEIKNSRLVIEEYRTQNSESESQ